MTFVCTVLGDDFTVNQNEVGNDISFIVDVGYDDERPLEFKLVLGFTPAIGGGAEELFFFVVQVDGETGDTVEHWSGAGVAQFIDKQSRTAILTVLLTLLDSVLEDRRPAQVVLISHDDNPPEEAHLKYHMIGEVFEAKGYKVQVPDVYQGRHSWWMERIDH